MKMEKESCVCEVMDPLANYWGLSLFPQIISSSSAAVTASSSSKPYDPNYDLDCIHNHLRSTILQIPADELKAVICENPGLFDSEISSDPACHEENDVVAEEVLEFPRKRRPALGLKRARFSLKPTKIQSVESLIPRQDLDKLKDPVEFFLAHERLENAKREIQKLTGVSLESNPSDTTTKPRQRRPGLSGNNERRVKYKHRYPKETFDNNNYGPPSQEASESVCLDSVGESADEGGACITPLENEEIDSPAIEENKTSDVLDRLLQCNSEDLEGDGAMTLLQETLQIKPIALEKLVVPEFPNNSQILDMKSLHGNSSKPRKRKPLSNLDNLLTGFNNRTPIRQDIGCLLQQSGSPTPPRSPFALLPLLQQHISRTEPSVDPFAADRSDPLSNRTNSPVPLIHQEPNLIASGKLSNVHSANIIDDGVAISKANSAGDTVRNGSSSSGESKKDRSGMVPTKLKKSLFEEIIATKETHSVEETVRDCATTPQKFVEDNSRQPQPDANIESKGPHFGMEVDIEDSEMHSVEDTIRDCASTPEKSLEDNPKKPEFDANIVSNGPHVDMDVDIGDSGMNVLVHSANIIDDGVAISKANSAGDTVRNGSSSSGESKEDRSGMVPTKLNIPLLEEIIATIETHSVEETIGDCAITPQKSVEDNSRQPQPDANIESKGPHFGMDVDIGDSEMHSVEDAIRDCASTPQKSLEDNPRQPEFDANAESNGPHVDMDVGIGDSGMNDRVGMPNIETSGPCEIEDDAENMQAHAAAVPSDDSNINLVNPPDQSDTTGFQANDCDKDSRRSDDGSEQCLQEKTDGNSLPDNRQRRDRCSRKQHIDRSLSRRQSLAAAGTSWEAGLRRSTRIRTRPLEYWKGERMVYGRVHNSLATVIGIKCISPGSDGKPTMKVKSYVSDEHKDLFELASLY